eukprot:COSAG02_NODE_1354_length_13100_cov_7.477040_11_plen_87_part_00
MRKEITFRELAQVKRLVSNISESSLISISELRWHAAEVPLPARHARDADGRGVVIELARSTVNCYDTSTRAARASSYRSASLYILI